MKNFRHFIQEKNDAITFEIPLLIRVLELAREEVKSDEEINRIVERLLDIKKKGALSMDDYKFIAHVKEEYVQEDGGGGGAAAVGGSSGGSGPTNVVGGGAIAGTGGSGGEPGVNMKKKKKVSNPIMMPTLKRKSLNP